MGNLEGLGVIRRLITGIAGVTRRPYGLQAYRCPDPPSKAFGLGWFLVSGLGQD